MLAEIDQGEGTGPIPLSESPAAFRRVIASGHFLPGVARYGTELRQGPAGPMMGSHVLSLLSTDAGLPVVVDRGWAPDESQPEAPAGLTTVLGYVRPAEGGALLGPGNDEAGRRFFSLDPAAIGRSLGAGAVAPFTLVVLGDGKGLPQTAAALPRPPNNHLSYAVTWFALSAVLVGGFGLYARQALRS